MRPIDLSQFPQPESNDSSSVEFALNAIRNAESESTSNEAYDAFLWAVGNNHAGTFYPVVLGALPEIEQILMRGTEWAKRAAIESLIDLGGSFAPEDGYENYLGASVQETLKAFIHSIRHYIAPLADGDNALAGSAAELLELIDDQAV
ncbi:hypothetical protein QWZ02_06000 [Kinneretia asaccharophila]|uniref:hypothetical protein n=1 Tax=Roseateles asaccharophilus TaxID=582607 RepID=UPI00105C110E|nr:hypothetical protein [Roseateles asaccharophilus]MDN3543996.1 hypothetical protein [Roseateles asaccharophilus]